MAENKAPEVNPDDPIQVILNGHLYVGVELRWSAYVQGEGESVATALELYADDEYGPERLAVATVNLDGTGAGTLGPDQVFIKDWSENAGMFASLVSAGVIESQSLPDGLPAVAVNQWGDEARVGHILEPYATAARDAVALVASQVKAFRP